MPEKKYRYIIVSEKEKLFCIREGYGNKKAELEGVGYKVIDYGRQEITSADIGLYEGKGYQFDRSGAFLTILQ